MACGHLVLDWSEQCCAETMNRWIGVVGRLYMRVQTLLHSHRTGSILLLQLIPSACNWGCIIDRSTSREPLPSSSLAFKHLWTRRRRGAYGDFVNFKMIVFCVCAFIGVSVCACIWALASVLCQKNNINACQKETSQYTQYCALRPRQRGKRENYVFIYGVDSLIMLCM